MRIRLKILILFIFLSAAVLIIFPSASSGVLAQADGIQTEVTFIYQDGSPDTVKTVTVGLPYGELPSPQRTGYILSGWFTESDGGTKVLENSLVTSGEPHSLYARWEQKEYTVNFFTNGGGFIPPLRLYYGEEIVPPEDPVRAGYSFIYWCADSALENQYVFGEMPAQNINLYAKWEVVIFEINYVYNGGESVDNPSQYSVTSPLIILNAPERNGYSFGGWYLTQDFSGSPVRFITTGTTGDLTFYAKWSPILTTVTYMGNSNTSGAVPTDNNTYQSGADITVLGNPNNLTKINFTFSGWSLLANGGGAVYREGSVIKADKANIVLYAVWTPVVYTVTYHYDGGTVMDNPVSVRADTAFAPLTASSKRGYTFGGWYRDAEFTGQPLTFVGNLTSDISLYARWYAIDYYITYNLDGGKNNAGNPEIYNIGDTVYLLDPEKDDMRFLGWYDSEGKNVTQIGPGAAGNTVLYARWAPAPSESEVILIAVSASAAGAVILVTVLIIILKRRRY